MVYRYEEVRRLEGTPECIKIQNVLKILTLICTGVIISVDINHCLLYGRE